MIKNTRNYSDILCADYKGYAEPVLLTGCWHNAQKKKMTRSEYIREAIIEKLIRDKFPLRFISSKFNEYYKGITYNQ